jgi:hypothetical protein
MRRRRNVHPRLESLESLSLLSGTAAALLQYPHVEISKGATIALGGTEHGVFYAQRDNSGTTYTVVAAPRLTPVGAEATSGNLRVLSGISSGPPSGTLHITTGRGTLTLQIPKSVALPVGLPAPTSSQEVVDTYVITRGTGAYRGDRGSGVVEFTFHGANSTTSPYQAGTVDVTFTTLASSS